MTRQVTVFLAGFVLFGGTSMAQTRSQWPDLPIVQEEVEEAPVEPAVAAATGQTLYAAGLAGSSVLYRIDNYETSPRARAIGDTLTVLYDVAIDPTTGRFYGMGAGGDLFELDRSTGRASRIGSTGRSLNSLEFDSGGQAWSWSNSGGELFRIDKATGAATLVGLVGFISGGDLAFDTDGTLYGAADGALILIDKTTGQGTLIGPFGISGAFGLEIDADGTMYVGQGDDFSNRAELYRVDKSTGTATRIGKILKSGPFGLAGLAFERPVVADEALSLRDGRFQVEVTWMDEDGTTGSGRPVPMSSDTGHFWFFSPTNVEVFVKILDGCGVNDHFWVFAGGLTDLRVEILVTNTATGATRRYSSPLGGTFRSVQDTESFACHQAADQTSAQRRSRL